MRTIACRSNLLSLFPLSSICNYSLIGTDRQINYQIVTINEPTLITIRNLNYYFSYVKCHVYLLTVCLIICLHTSMKTLVSIKYEKANNPFNMSRSAFNVTRYELVKHENEKENANVILIAVSFSKGAAIFLNI